jgi:hypothetical protein
VTASAFIGSWRLVSFVEYDASGKPRPYWGEHPIGFLVYTREGMMAAQIYDERRRAERTNWPATIADVAQRAFAGSAAYFGGFSVDERAGIVTHHVNGATGPDWIGQDFVRAYRFLAADRLELSVVETSAAAARQVLTWERIQPTV